jgi:hypothetical protein
MRGVAQDITYRIRRVIEEHILNDIRPPSPFLLKQFERMTSEETQ